MANDKFKFEADVAGWVKGKEQVRTGLDQIEKKAVATSHTVEKASIKMEASMKRAARAGAIVNATSGAAGAVAAGGGSMAVARQARNRALQNAYRGFGGTAIGSAAAGALAGRGAGALGGRVAGGVLGAFGGPAGAIVGSIIGSTIAGTVGGKGEPSQEEITADHIQQLVRRGFTEPAAKSIEQMARDMEAKFQVDSERIQAAVVEAKAGDAGAIRSILEDIGINPGTVQSINDALAKMAESSAGAAEAAEDEKQGPVGRALESLGQTEAGAFTKDFFSGVAKAPGELWDNLVQATANDINRLTGLLGGPAANRVADAKAETTQPAPALETDAPLNKPEKLRRGDMRIIVGSPKNVPTLVKRTGGR